MTLTANTEVDICNNGLDLIGARPINSIVNPTTDKEATCARLYKMTVSGLLSRHDWKFTNQMKQLAHNADQDPFGGKAYAYKLPSLLLAGPFSVYEASNLGRPVHNYIHARDHIHTDNNTCYVRYHEKTLVETWPEYFVHLASVACASVFAKPIAESGEMATEYRIQAFGSANENGEGGLFGAYKGIDSKSAPLKSLFRNGDPLTGLVY